MDVTTNSNEAVVWQQCHCGSWCVWEQPDGTARCEDCDLPLVRMSTDSLDGEEPDEPSGTEDLPSGTGWRVSHALRRQIGLAQAAPAYAQLPDEKHEALRGRLIETLAGRAELSLADQVFVRRCILQVQAGMSESVGSYGDDDWAKQDAAVDALDDLEEAMARDDFDPRTAALTDEDPLIN